MTLPHSPPAYINVLLLLDIVLAKDCLYRPSFMFVHALVPPLWNWRHQSLFSIDIAIVCFIIPLHYHDNESRNNMHFRCTAFTPSVLLRLSSKRMNFLNKAFILYCERRKLVARSNISLQCVSYDITPYAPCPLPPRPWPQVAKNSPTYRAYA